ncbi:MAG: hypothetical protein L3J88_09030 [Gammaproteobacteria bacterium]|nr:hypothetical protein [Gammaproteobacteria bacterium]MCF6363471.1 hypothetical protein [Gammaproteobacteria bacterium]
MPATTSDTLIPLAIGSMAYFILHSLAHVWKKENSCSSTAMSIGITSGGCQDYFPCPGVG